jgi:LmbE family N-acetylglucosaminyl deacetylase
MKCRIPILCAVALSASVALASSGPGTALPPPSTGGIAAVAPALKKLTTSKRLLVVGAHPDDENTALLALVARGMGGEAAYLSLSRGEGGQNLIGDELGVGLGLIRSQELAAARRLDGARQYFTRAYDFGFSKSLDEALRFWPKEEILKDAVRVIRRFQPQVVFATFTGTPADGHGQHQESGVIAREAFRAAGDPQAFPELAAEGLAPWKPTVLVRSNWFDDTNSIKLSTGDVDPLTGRSYNQIAMAGRSLHRSQEMGRIQPAGPSQTGAIWEAGGGGAGTKDLFGGADTSLPAIADHLTDSSRRGEIRERLIAVQRLAEAVQARLTPQGLSAAVADLATILEQLHAARGVLAAEAPAAAILDEKIEAAQTALAAAAGVALDAVAENETAAPGDAFSVTLQLWNAGSSELGIEALSLESPDGWTASAPVASGEHAPAVKSVAAGALAEWKATATVPAGAAPTVPYFLKKPLRGALYDWSDVPAAVRGEPFQPAPLWAAARIRIAGATVTLRREVTYRFRSEEYGEIRHALRAVPKIEVSVTPDLVVWPTAQKGRRVLDVTVTSNVRGPVSGQVEVAMPAGWPAAAPQRFSLAQKGEKASLEVAITAPSSPRPGRFSVAVAAELSGGERYASSVHILDYEHIRPTPMPREASLSLTAVDLRLPRLRSVGYVRGAADRVPEALSAVGVPLHILAARDLEHGDLSAYDAIVVGSRAYETEPALSTANGRLLDYVRAGGLVIVQYQQYPFVAGGFAPEKLEIARPHDRVSDETANVTVLDRAHPIFNSPNRLGPSDWDGWVQERGLYFAHTWASGYVPLLAMNDPDQPEQRGSLLVAAVGKGHYVYTGLAFFRQLPAGVPGAYRLFANLLAWKPGGSEFILPESTQLAPH